MFIRFRKKSQQDLHLMQDEELISCYRNSGNAEAIGVLFQRYTHLVYGVCLKYLGDQDDARDAVMEIFEGLLDSLSNHEVLNFKNWLHSVTRNHCLMKLRKSSRIIHEEISKLEKSEEKFVEKEVVLHPDDEMKEIYLQELESALGLLREEQRQCIELVYLKEKSYQEVSKITGFTVKEVKSHVQNGKRNLKIKLEEKGVG
jgi:RNA polymerase sigma-70 factor (ECF subfamily)